MIEDFNPWWAFREGVEEVEIYRRYAESGIEHRPCSAFCIRCGGWFNVS